MATMRIGFEFDDRTFFNITTEESVWETLEGVNCCFNAPLLAARMASEHGISLSSTQLVNVHKGGLYADTTMDGVLLKMVQVVTEDNQQCQLLSEDRPPSSLSNADSGLAEDIVEGPGNHQWTDNATLYLLDSYTRHKRRFQSPCMKKMDVWKLIAEDMVSAGYSSCTADCCEKKFSNMKIREERAQVNYPTAAMHSNSPGPEEREMELPGPTPHQTSKEMEVCINLTRKKVPNLPSPPAEPEAFPRLKKSQKALQPRAQQIKAFMSEGPTLHEQLSPTATGNPSEKSLVQSQNENEMGNSILGTLLGTQPVTGFVKGCVKLTREDEVMMTVAELEKSSGTGGCISNENFQPFGDTYQENFHFDVAGTLGAGSYGKVQLCYDRKSQIPFTRKVIQKSALTKNEIPVPLEFNHRNMTQFYGLIQRENCDGTLQMELVLEYAGTSLNVFMRDKKLKASEIWKLTEQGLTGLQHLDESGYIHLDIKPENICLAEKRGELVLKITDFGSAKRHGDEVSFAGWTPEYMAPESCQLVLQKMQIGVNFGVDQECITSKVDVFAFALVMIYCYKGYHILLRVITDGRKTYGGMPSDQVRALQTKLMYNLADRDLNLVGLLIPDEVDMEMRDLMQRMTTHRYKGRPDALQSLESVMVKKLGFVSSTMQNKIIL